MDLYNRSKNAGDCLVFVVCVECLLTYNGRCGLCSEIIGNTEYHIRVIELLLQSSRWDEKLPDCITAPGLYQLLIFEQMHLPSDVLHYSPMLN